MQISIRGDLTPALEQHIRERLLAALGQFDTYLTSVDAVLTDENGPKGGVDQRFRVAAHARKGDPLVVEHMGSDAYLTVSDVADRLKNAVGRDHERAREHRGHGSN